MLPLGNGYIGGTMPNAGKTERLRFTAVWMKQKWTVAGNCAPRKHRSGNKTPILVICRALAS